MLYPFPEYELIKTFLIQELRPGSVGLLYGAPGCGKSTLAYKLAEEYHGHASIWRAGGEAYRCWIMPAATVNVGAVTVTHFWQRAIATQPDAGQPILFIIDNADVLIRHLPVFIHDFRQLAASHRAGASLLFVGSAALRRHRKIKALITLPIGINPPTGDEVHDFMLHQMDENKAISLRLAFTDRAANAAQGNLALLSRIARSAHQLALAGQATALTVRQEGQLLNLLAPQRSALRSGNLLTLYAGLAFTFGWLSFDALKPVLPAPAWLIITPAEKPQVADINDTETHMRDAMQQLFSTWGYDVSPEEAWCDQAERAELICESGKDSLHNLAERGLPWIVQLKVNKGALHAVVMRVSDSELDLLIAGKTWTVLRGWFEPRWDGNYVLMEKQTPDGKMTVSDKSPPETVVWLDALLSRALNVPVDKQGEWTPTLTEKVKLFQQRENLRQDGRPGKRTLIRLQQALGEAPQLINESTSDTQAIKESTT